VYAVNNSLVDVWIMAVSGLVGYALRKLDFEIAPIILGLVLAPMIELNFRQSLALSAGDYSVFFTRPLATGMLGIAIVLLVLGMRSAFRRKDVALGSARTEG
jgi:putative tricarboxylic transport membrane protein